MVHNPKVRGGWSLVIAVLLGTLAIGRCGCFVAVDGKRLQALAQQAGFEGKPAVSRNGAGTRIFLTGRVADHAAIVEIVSADGVFFKRFDSGRPVVDDDGKLVAWVTNHLAGASATGSPKALAFATGEEIPLVFGSTSPGTFQFSPGARFFLLDQPAIPAAMLRGWDSLAQPVAFLTSGATNMEGYPPRWKAVFRTKVPTQPLFRLPSDFYARDIFTRDNQLMVSGLKFIFGPSSKTGRAELEKEEAWALVFSEGASGYKLTTQLDLSRFSGVLDLDPVSGVLLVRGKGEALADWGLFDPETGKYKSFGRAGAHGFFLEPEFSRYLESRW